MTDTLREKAKEILARPSRIEFNKSKPQPSEKLDAILALVGEEKRKTLDAGVRVVEETKASERQRCVKLLEGLKKSHDRRDMTMAKNPTVYNPRDLAHNEVLAAAIKAIEEKP